jgi:hypothetical protein
VPSSVPTSVPSDMPSRPPQSSSPTLLGDTPLPTSDPTARPSVDPAGHLGRWLYSNYTEHMQAADAGYGGWDGSLNGQQQQQHQQQHVYAAYSTGLPFGHYLYKRDYVDRGRCDDWGSYIGASLAPLPFSNVQYTTITAVYGLAHTGGGEGEVLAAAAGLRRESGGTATCTNASTVGRLVQAMHTGTPFSERCGEHSWRVEVCNAASNTSAPHVVFCVARGNCRKICDTCAEGPHLGVMDACGARYGLGAGGGECAVTEREAFVVVSVGTTATPDYPVLEAPLMVVGSRMSVAVTANVTGAGQVLCQAQPMGQQPTLLFHDPQSLAAWGSATLTSAFENTSYSITIGGLAPDTQYSIYCATIGDNGRTMPPTAVFASRTDAVTACCRALVYDTFHSQVANKLCSPGH